MGRGLEVRRHVAETAGKLEWCTAESCRLLQRLDATRYVMSCPHADQTLTANNSRSPSYDVANQKSHPSAKSSRCRSLTKFDLVCDVYRSKTFRIRTRIIHHHHSVFLIRQNPTFRKNFIKVFLHSKAWHISNLWGCLTYPYHLWDIFLCSFVVFCTIWRFPTFAALNSYLTRRR